MLPKKSSALDVPICIPSFSLGKLSGCTTLSALGIARTFNFSGSDVCVMVSEYDFNFCFFIRTEVVTVTFINLFTLTRLKIFHPLKGCGS